MARVFALDVHQCEGCGSRMKILCAIHGSEAILECLGLLSWAPPISPALHHQQGDRGKDMSFQWRPFSPVPTKLNALFAAHVTETGACLPSAGEDRITHTTEY
jgi:hypothetical protein